MVNIPNTHQAMSSDSDVYNSLEFNKASGGHIGFGRDFGKCKNNIKYEFSIHELCKINILLAFLCRLIQKLMKA